jgi:hypothetical protein
MEKLDPPGNDVVTFRRIRKAIGILGISLPIILIVFSSLNLSHTGFQFSISHYYFSNFREIFTGILCSVGLFLILYKGHKNPVIWKNDSLMTNLAGTMAFGIAFFPTSPIDCNQKIYTIVPICGEWLGYLHYGFATVFFFILAIISIFVFTIGQVPPKDGEKSVLNENNIYVTCGILIILFMILTFVFEKLNFFKYSTLIFEALMLFAFGISWLIKGRILGDKGEVGKKLYNE